MVYNWENFESICYQMYIEDKRSLEDIMEYMKAHHNFSPSKRAYQTQFKRWEFPSKQNPAHKNAELVQRVKELWERNTSQREMLRILNEEDGYDIKERELMRVRAKNRWLLRVPNGMKNSKRPRNSEQDVIDQLNQALYEDGRGQVDTQEESSAYTGRGLSPELSPVVLAKRQERLNKLQAESADRWASRKRRRRTRGWAGLPADPPGPPRFPSETTIDESKAFLVLDSNLYRDLRARFQRICEDADVIKKTLAGPEKWEAVKSRLIQESPHLQTIFWEEGDNIEAKKLALDVVCTDVTKRMRTLERRMTIAEAKNALGVNPEESRQVRNAFYQTLKDDHFTSKLEAGDEHWKALKASWIDGSDLLKSILAPGDADPNHQEKVKAMEVLCRDVMKRLRDDQTKRDPTRRKKFDTNFDANNSSHSLGPFGNEHHDMDSFHLDPHDALVQAAAHAQAQVQPQIPNHPHAGVASHNQASDQDIASHGDLQIDPSLLLAAANDPSLSGSGRFTGPYDDHQYGSQSVQPSFTSSGPIAAYFRIHPASDVQTNTPIWISTLSTISVDEIRRVVSTKFPDTIVVRIAGIMDGNDMNLQIDRDEELHAYLTAVEGAKPIFAVQLMQGWKSG